MNLQVIKNRALYWAKTLSLYTAYISLVLFIFSYILLQIPAVQRYLINYYVSGYSQVSGFPVTIEKFHLTWYDRLELEGVLIKDPQHNTMISAGKIKINFTISKLMKRGDLYIDEASVEQATVNLINIQESDTSKNLNINIFIHTLEGPDTTSSRKSSAKINISKIFLDHSSFSYNDPDEDSIKTGFDYYHFGLGVNQGKLNEFKVIGDTIQFDVAGMKIKDKNSSLSVDQLSTFFRISQTGMEFKGMDAHVGKSHLSDTILFYYATLDDMKDFNDKVKIDAHLHKTVIDPRELIHFTYGYKALPKPLYLDGQLTGKVTRFDCRNMTASTGNTEVRGDLSMDGLPYIDETFIDLALKEGEIYTQDIRSFFPEKIYKRVDPLQHIQISGQFTGFINDFVAKGDFSGEIGEIKSDLNLKINAEQIDQSTFSGNIELKDFDMGTYFNDTINFQKVTLNGKIFGKGLTEESTDFNLSGTISSVGFLHYDYKNISTNARFAKQLFNGELSIDDPHLVFKSKGFIDFRKGKEIVRIKATIDTLALDKLGFIKEHLFFRSTVDINTQGLNLDSITGSVTLKNSVIEYTDRMLALDSVHIISKVGPQYKTMEFLSSLADVRLKGNYFYPTLFNDLTRLINEFKLNIRNDRIATTQYYNKKVKSTQSYETDFTIQIHDFNPAIQLTKIPLYLSRDTKLDGKFSNGITSEVKIYGNVDTIIYKKRKFLQNKINISGSKIRDSSRVLATISLHSEKQELSSALKSKNLQAEVVWNNDHIDIMLDADQEGNTNLLRLRSSLDLLDDSIRIKILPSRLRIFDKDWGVNPRNYALVKGKEWNIHALEMNHETESVLIDGTVSDNPDKIIQLSVVNLNLNILNSISVEKIGGILNAEVSGRDIYQNPYIQNQVTISNLMVDDFLVGDVTGKNVWNREDKRFDVNFTIDRSEKRTVTMKGYYDPEQLDPLSIKAHLEKTNIKIIEPFMKGIFSQMDGTLSGDYTITGAFLEPIIKGEGKIESGQIMIDYLHTLYNFNGILAFTPSQIQFKNFMLSDGLKNTGTLTGFLGHNFYNEFKISLNADFKNLQVLNTTSRDNEQFYGQGYASGTLNIEGPLSNLKITATAKSEKNTRILIPLGGSTQEVVGKKDFIKFVQFKDTLALKKKIARTKNRDELSGLTFDLNLDITPDAYAEIIFDIKSGDIIRGYGNGDLKLQLDTKGEFNMFGVYEFEKGNYNFTLYDIINKEFTINKGSRISWYGDPYSGVMSINASYRQLASLSPVIAFTDPTDANTSQMRRKYPVEVLLKLDGPMLSPQINFDITAKDLPNLVFLDNSHQVALSLRFNEFKAKLDEQELKKQVFSLIVLRRFSPTDAFTTNGTISNSVSELLSNQLSYWLTQVDQNLEIDFDLGTFDQEAFNTFQLRLSYSFLNGRLRVTRDGTFNNQYNRSEVANMLGDWTVDYLLTADGKFKVKMYNRTNINQLTNTLSSQTAITTGFSLLHTQNFNHWSDLLTSARNRRRKELESQNVKVGPNGTQ